MWRTYDLGNTAGVRTWSYRVQTSPGWVVKAALAAAALVVIVPIVLLVLAAVAAGAMVFFVLTFVVWVALTFKRLVHNLVGGARDTGQPLWADDGRRNVRVRRVGPGQTADANHR